MTIQIPLRLSSRLRGRGSQHILAGTLLFLAALCVGTVAMGAVPARADELPFGAELPPGSPYQQTGYYLIDSKPGRSIECEVLLTNTSNKALTLQLAGVDASTGPYGGVSYETVDEKVDAMGAWIDLDQKQVQLAVNARVIAKFTVNVPADAAPGDHVGGLVAMVPTKDEGKTVAGGQEAGAVVVVQPRRVIAVQVVVPGTAEPTLAIDNVVPVARPDAMYLGIQIESTGQLLTQGHGTIELTDGSFGGDINLGTFVPGTSIEYPVKWTQAPEPGDYPAYVKILYDDDKRVAEWRGTVTVGDTVMKDLENRLVGGVPGAGGMDWIIYAAIIGGIVLLIFIISIWLALLVGRRRRRDEQEAS